MLQSVDFKQFKTFAEKSRHVVVSREIDARHLAPINVFQTLSCDKKDAVLLDSSVYSNPSDACIYLGFDPIAEYQSFGSTISIYYNGEKEAVTGNAIQSLREFYHRFRAASLASLAKFAGGMIGFVAYDAIRQIENIPDRHPNNDHIPDMEFKFYGTHIVFDKRSATAVIAKLVIVTDDLERCYQNAQIDIDALINKMNSSKRFKKNLFNKSNKNDSSETVEVDIIDAEYEAMVKKAKHYISQGEAFQIVLSRRFRRKYQGDTFNIYKALRESNPSPYQFYIRNKNFTIVGASPERLVNLQNGIVETMPIAGTKKRGRTQAEDIALENELLADEKEIAEHMMLVDLGRNDVGAISQPGSVNVVEKAVVQRFSRVMHLVSRIQGKISKGFDAFDVIKMAFPAGTLSGSPKIRAMEIIDEIETTRRGVYGGAICAIDNKGQMDSCITIRTAFIKDGVATVRAGGGVVIDSNPQKEAEETRHKAQAVLDALSLAEQGVA